MPLAKINFRPGVNKETTSYGIDVDVVPDRWNSMDVATQTQWADYRQALRDLPATTDDPANPTWPVAPA